MKHLILCMVYTDIGGTQECKGSVVERLTLNGGVAGSSLAVGTVLCPRAKALYPLLITGSIQEGPPQHD